MVIHCKTIIFIYGCILVVFLWEEINIYEVHSVVPPPQESMNNGPSLFDYRLDNPYNDLIDDFDPYLEYGKEYQNWTGFKDAFYR